MSRDVSRPKGSTVEYDADGTVVQEMYLYWCCHCQRNWEAPLLSFGGKLAGGFCGKCVGFYCRNPACAECIPWEQRLENVEAGRPLLTPRPVCVAVPPEISAVVSKHVKGKT